MGVGRSRPLSLLHPIKGIEKVTLSPAHTEGEKDVVGEGGEGGKKGAIKIIDTAISDSGKKVVCV